MIEVLPIGAVERPLWQLLRPLYLRGDNPYPPVVALAAYFDESRNAERGIVAIAGYFAPVSVWDDRFAPAWREMIARAAHPISEFKAADCRHGRGEFSNWTPDERRSLTREAVDLILAPGHRPIGLGAAVVIDAPDDLSEEHRRWHADMAYFWCFAELSRLTIHLCDEYLGKDRLHYVFDDEKRLKHRARTWFPLALEHVAEARSGRANEPSFADSKELPPLQAADLLAYETYKELANRMESPQREPSTALRRLVSGGQHFGYYEMQSELLRQIEQRDRGDPAPTFPEFRYIYHSRRPEGICR